jgi:hypothetical protein
MNTEPKKETAPETCAYAEEQRLVEIQVAKEARLRKAYTLVAVGCVAFAAFHFRGSIKGVYDSAVDKPVVVKQGESFEGVSKFGAGSKAKETVKAVNADLEKRNAEMEQFFK